MDKDRASKPIEIELLHRYNPKVLPDAKHGEPYHAKWIDGTTPIVICFVILFP
jgi:hypothetical protein